MKRYLLLPVFLLLFAFKVNSAGYPDYGLNSKATVESFPGDETVDDKTPEVKEEAGLPSSDATDKIVFPVNYNLSVTAHKI